MDLLLDTDVLLWMSRGDPKLGARTRDAIEAAAIEGSLRVSAISLLEVARLYWDGRVELPLTPEAWYRELLDAGVREIPVTAEIAMLAASLEPRHGFHADPADQIVTAASVVTKRVLVTSDRKILKWAASRSQPECLNVPVERRLARRGGNGGRRGSD